MEGVGKVRNEWKMMSTDAKQYTEMLLRYVLIYVRADDGELFVAICCIDEILQLIVAVAEKTERRPRATVRLQLLI